MSSETGEPNGSLDSSQLEWLKKMSATLNVVLQLAAGPAATSPPGVAGTKQTAGTASFSASSDKRIVPGGGGYIFEQHADGKIFIIESPKHGKKRIEVTDPKAIKAILAQIGPYPAASQPKAPPAAPPSAANKSTTGEGLFDQIIGAAGDAADLATGALRDLAAGIGDALDEAADFLGLGDGDSAKKPEPAKDDTPPILGGAETETEKKLAQFTKAMSGIVVMVDNKPVTVRPPYFIHRDDSLTAAKANRDNKDNSKVAKLYKEVFSVAEFSAKATPAQMQDFLQKAVDQGLVTDKSAKGLRQFLDDFGVSTDCSGLAVQALNFLADGDMVRGDNEAVDVNISNATALANTNTGSKYEAVSAPSKLQAGDMMVKAGVHVRLITDVDESDGAILFTTLESTGDDDVAAGGDGVGERRWRFPDSKKFDNLEIQTAGHTQSHSGAAQAGSTTKTIKLASSASTKNKYYNGVTIRLTAGPGAGEERKITSYVGSTRVATVDAAWTAVPTAATQYEIPIQFKAASTADTAYKYTRRK
jgi:hypothetical protein